MSNDPIVDEVRRVRHEHAAKFGFDLRAICDDIRARERASGRKYVSLPPRLIAKETSDVAEHSTASGG
jgi:hypothetical protein